MNDVPFFFLFQKSYEFMNKKEVKGRNETLMSTTLLQ